VNFIPGAAYLSPSKKQIYIGCESGWLLYRSMFDDESFLTDEEFFPADLVLLYAPGDTVVVGSPHTGRPLIYAPEHSDA